MHCYLSFQYIMIITIKIVKREDCDRSLQMHGEAKIYCSPDNAGMKPNLGKRTLRKPLGSVFLLFRIRNQSSIINTQY